MVLRSQIDDRLCFVLMPFGGRFDEYYSFVIKPAIESVGLVARRADEIYGTDAIISDVWRSIWKARAIVADVTDKNPNVIMSLDWRTQSACRQFS